MHSLAVLNCWREVLFVCTHSVQMLYQRTDFIFSSSSLVAHGKITVSVSYIVGMINVVLLL